VGVHKRPYFGVSKLAAFIWCVEGLVAMGHKQAWPLASMQAHPHRTATRVHGPQASLAPCIHASTPTQDSNTGACTNTMQEEGNYRLAHSKLFNTVKRLEDLSTKPPQELMRSLVSACAAMLMLSLVRSHAHAQPGGCTEGFRPKKAVPSAPAARPVLMPCHAVRRPRAVLGSRRGAQVQLAPEVFAATH